jgi:hypothetical protein
VCKHGAFCMEHGLLPVAPVESAPVAVALACDDESAFRLPARPARSSPSVEDEAYASGYSLQFDHGISADAPAEWQPMRSSAFRLGQADGLIERNRIEDLEREAQILHEERLEAAFGDLSDRIHDAERCGYC